MKNVESWIQVNPKDKKEVITVEMYMDNFGKYHTFTKLFDRFTLEKQVFDNKDMLEAQAASCMVGTNFKGWRL